MNRRVLLILLAAVTVLAIVVPVGVNRIVASRIQPPDDAQLVSFDGETPPSGDAEADASGEDGEPGEREASRDADRSRKAPTPTLNSYLNPIMDRSLFDSSKVGSTGSEIAGADGETEQEATDLGATLILTSVAADPRFSTALIQLDQEDEFPELFSLGDAISDAEIESIVRRRVYVRRNTGALEYLEIGGEEKDKKKSSRKSSDDDKKKKRRGRTDWSEGITKIDDTHYQVERDAIDNALTQLDRLSRDARVVPNYQDGQPNGFKIFSIKRNSAYKHLGLKNNDVITGVNGMEIKDPKSAMDVYNKLQSESHINLEILRKGESVTLEYDVM